MAATDGVFAGSIPELYDRLLVPIFFEFYARDLSERIAAIEPRDVLETAAGTGVLTRALAARLPEQARIVATDLNQPMIDYAQGRALDAGRIAWRPADALALPFPDSSFDAVACQFGVMFFPDKRRCYEEAGRVLRPGGRFVFSVWDRIFENDFAHVVTEAVAALFKKDPPRFLARTPHGYYDVSAIHLDLESAGFSHRSVEALDGISKASSARDVAVGFCQGTPLRNEIEARDASRLEEATDRAAEALRHKFGDGAIEGRMRAFVFTAARQGDQNRDNH